MNLNRPKRTLRPEISVVVPLFNEQENLSELYDRLVQALEGREFELVLVNDGSRDATAALLDQLHVRDGRVVVIHLSRNFGHQAAISAGIDHARGRAVILMDGDLQDPPEILPQLIGSWREGNDVVYAIRAKRKEHLVKRACFAIFYRVFRKISDLDIPLDSGDFCLMDRKAVRALRHLPEKNRFVRGLRSFIGFQQAGVVYDRPARHAGQPKYTFKALCRLALDGLFGFSSLPLSLVSYAGGCLAIAALLGGAWAGWRALQQGDVPGWALVALALIACTAAQLLGMGILSEYIRRIFLEVKGRPTYVVGAVRGTRSKARRPSRRKFSVQCWSSRAKTGG